MADDARLPEADRLDGALHPRDTPRLFGQQDAERTFLESYSSGKLHHAWLIFGPAGVGKATLAWRLTRFVLANDQQTGGLFGNQSPASLDVEEDNPVARRLRAGAEGRMHVLRRPWDEKAKRLKTRITVDEVRKLKSFFGLSAADGGRRVVLIDAAEDMNDAAANALLKVLEEPPPDAFIFLVSHQPTRLLPTIRSRCRTLRCLPLSTDDMEQALIAQDTTLNPALQELAAGSVGAAIALERSESLTAYANLLSLFSRLPEFDRQAAVRMSETASARAGDTAFELLVTLLADQLLARLAKTGSGLIPKEAAAEGEIAVLSRLAPDAAAARAWAQLQAKISSEARRAKAVNLDPTAVFLDLLLQVRKTGCLVIGTET
ncbi:MAG: DNA polymerase III subunit delta' [Pseudomonadota bacterium]